MIDKWQFDSLKVMLAFETYLGITPHEWTQADADTPSHAFDYGGNGYKAR